MIVFRTDASQETGFGHIKRSTMLASLLKNKNKILFCIGKDKVAGRFLNEKNIPFCRMKQLPEKEITSIIFDLRHFSEADTQLIKRCRAGNKKTIQITDLGLSQQEVDFTIDCSLEPLFPFPTDRRLLSGPDYTILHNKFRHFNKLERKYRKGIRNVFIALGGGIDYKRLRGMVDLLSRHRYKLKIAPGFYLKPSAVKTLRRIYPGIRFVGATDNLARSLFEADAAVIAPGITAYEAAAVGTPALYFYYHDEQKATALSLENRGAGLVIANIDDLLGAGKQVIEKMQMLPVEKRIEMGARGKQLVDARGAYRIIEFFEQEKII